MNKRNILKYKGYTHFDIRKAPGQYYSKVKNPSWVTKHGFYPFIHYKISSTKYSGEELDKRIKKTKNRDIYYSSHIDRYVYQYYAEKLNISYNKYAKSIGINKCVIAYRKGLKGKNNIHFAKEVFEFISKKERAIIIVGDFESFFDNLDHNYLKKTINLVQGSSRLRCDEYKVYRSITRYAYISLEDIESYLNKNRKEMSNLEKYFSTEEFQKFKRKHLLLNKSNYGIPQGSPISSVYSNCYMVEFDKEINSLITGLSGLYRRYCDDFIIVLPYGDEDDREEIKNWATKTLEDGIGKIPNLKLHPDKSTTLSYRADEVDRFERLDGYGYKLDYLGFSFDGRRVQLREKSLFKFYSRAYKKVKKINKHIGEKHYFSMKKSLYRLYTHLGDRRYGKNKGNFITYARKAHEIMSSSDSLESNIRNQYKRHWNKIIKRIE